MSRTRGLAAVLMVPALVAAVAACDRDEASEPAGQQAVVRVESAAPRPAIASICIGDVCNTFDPAEDARSAEFAVVVDSIVAVEVRLVGDALATRGDIGPGGCMDVQITEFEVAVDAGCPPVETD